MSQAKAKQPPKNRPELVREARAAGITPLAYMLSLVGDERLDPLTRLDAAKAAAPYCHPKVPSEVHLFRDDAPPKPVNVLELAKQVAFLFTIAERRPHARDRGHGRKSPLGEAHASQ